MIREQLLDLVDDFVETVTEEVGARENPEQSLLGLVLINVYGGDLLAFSVGVATAVDASPCHCGECPPVEDLSRQIVNWASAMLTAAEELPTETVH